MHITIGLLNKHVQRMLIVVLVLLAASVGWVAANAAEQAAPAQAWVPPADSPLARGEHPRLFLTAADLPGLRARILQYYKGDFQAFVDQLDRDYGASPSSFKELDVFAYGRGYAFLSLLDPQSMEGIRARYTAQQYADKAVEYALHYGTMSGYSDDHSAGNTSRLIMLALGVIYDWTHPLTTQAEKRAIADILIRRYNNRDPDVRPPYGGKPGIENHKAIWVHDVVFPALALYGDPALTDSQRAAADAALEDFYQVFIVRQLQAGSAAFVNSLGQPSTGSPEGDSYSDDVYSGFMWAAGAASSAMGENLFAKYGFLRDVPLFIYAYTIPLKVDGEYQFDNQDTSSMASLGGTQSRLMLGYGWHLREVDPDRAAFAAWWVYQSPYGVPPDSFKYRSPVRSDLFFKFLWGLRDVPPKDPQSAGVPLALRMGNFDVLRSDHNSESATRLLFWNTTYWYRNGHQEVEISSINLQKYGTLLVDYINTKNSGDDIPKCDNGKAPVQDNLMGINSGGDMLGFNMGEVEPGSGDPMPEWFYPGSPAQVGENRAVEHVPGSYDYIHYDYTRAFKGGNQVNGAARQLVYLRGPKDQEFIILHDVIDSSVEKRWVARVPFELELLDGSWNAQNSYTWTGTGRTFSMTNRYGGVAHGQLFIRSLLPEQVEVLKFGGPRTPYVRADGTPFCTSFGGRTYGERAKYWTGQYRLELRSQEGEFLTVMQVGDANSLSSMAPATRISAGVAEGVQIGNRVVLFSRNPNGAPLEQLAYSVSASGELQHLVVNLVPNAQYELEINGQSRTVYSSNQGTVTFSESEAGSRTISLRKAGAAPPPTFIDVPYSHPYYEDIEALYQAGYVKGCSTTPMLYCPERAMTRAESAVFVVRGVHGADFEPPQPSEQIFGDVELTAWYADWVTQLWLDGYTAGCSAEPRLYCPERTHTRAEGAVFFLRMMYGPDYQPPAAKGYFADVAADKWYAPWVDAAWEAGIAEPCATEPELRYCPEDPLTRAVAAYMMARAKGLITP